MKWAVGSDVAEYVEKYGKMIIPSAILMDVCFGLLAQSDAVRIDTEELINQPGTTVGWLLIGRFGLVFLKGLLGLGTHNAVKSGLLFLLFFSLSANFLVYALYHFSGKDDRYPYWAFMLLYITSNIWCYQIYFSLQQAEVALAMFLLVVAAMLSMEVCFRKQGRRNIMRLFLSTVLLVIGLGAYQALAAYYIAVCIALFLVMLPMLEENKLVPGIGKLIAQFGVSYVIYDVIAKTWFMADAGYMGDQMGWGRLPTIECIKNVLRTAKNIVLGYGPRNFSFYTIGVLLAVTALILVWREWSAGSLSWTGLRFTLFVLGVAGVITSPFFMTIYMGEMLVTRSQSALPVAAAFLGMYGIGCLRGTWKAPACRGDARVPESGEEPGAGKWRRRAAAAAGVLVVLAVVVQTGYDLRLYYTDEVRMKMDVQKTGTLLGELRERNGGELPKQPVIFVGYQKPELNRLCGRTEMYGWSFYEWDYNVANPTGATHRICGFVQAYTGEILNEHATEEQRRKAVQLAEGMQDFPEDGFVYMAEDYVVVRLSEVTERTDIDWW